MGAEQGTVPVYRNTGHVIDLLPIDALVIPA
jgi:hypothetical protein